MAAGSHAEASEVGSGVVGRGDAATTALSRARTSSILKAEIAPCRAFGAEGPILLLAQERVNGEEAPIAAYGAPP